MAQKPKHLEVPGAIDRHLSDSFYSASRAPDGMYQPWYALLLSSIALLAANEEVLYAYSDSESSTTDYHIIVFTTNLVLIASIDPELDGVPTINAVRRRSLIGMKLSASERIDARDRRAYEWPGVLNLALTYSDLPNRIEIVARGAARYNIQEPSPIVALIEGLSADLAANHTNGT